MLQCGCRADLLSAEEIAVVAVCQGELEDLGLVRLGACCSRGAQLQRGAVQYASSGHAGGYHGVWQRMAAMVSQSL
jgi:hypothetical protein